MYLPFQAFFLWYLVFLYRAVIDDCQKSRIYMYCLSAVGLLLWEGGIFVLLLNFIPPKLNIEKLRWKDFFIASIILIGCLILVTTDFRMMGMTDTTPASIQTLVSQHVSSYHKGIVLLILNIADYPLWALAAIIPLAISIYVSWRVAQHSQTNWFIRGFMVGIIICSTLNLFGFVFYLSLLLFLYNPAQFWQIVKSKLILLFTALSANLIFWVLFGLLTPVLTNYFPDATGSGAIRKLAVALVKFPNLFDNFIFVDFDI